MVVWMGPSKPSLLRHHGSIYSDTRTTYPSRIITGKEHSNPRYILGLANAFQWMLSRNLLTHSFTVMLNIRLEDVRIDVCWFLSVKAPRPNQFPRPPTSWTNSIDVYIVRTKIKCSAFGETHDEVFR